MSDSPDTLSPDNKSARWVVLGSKKVVWRDGLTHIVRIKDWEDHLHVVPNNSWIEVARTELLEEAEALAALWLASQEKT